MYYELLNELKLCSLQHRNIIGLIGFSKTNENFYLVYELFQAKPLSELIKGAATVKTDVFAFGLLSLQLITKDGRTAYAVEEGQDISLHHTLD
ncbi:Cysteine-rich receptor-like protein kinase 41 [Bienertia sinuspersici]